MATNQICSYCNGQGYVEIRDCTGDIQREETCMLCGGTGKREIEIKDRRDSNPELLNSHSLICKLLPSRSSIIAGNVFVASLLIT